MVRRVERVEDLLDAVDVLARPDLFVLVDLRLRARAFDVRDRIRAEQHETAVVDLEGVTIERTRRRAGRAIALRVVLAAVARAAEAGGDDRKERDLPVLAGLGERLQPKDRAARAVRLHRATEMRAMVRDNREA